MSKFKNGNSFGRGRRRGSRNKATLIREAISQADSVGVVRAMVRKARGGDVPAARLVLPYICPAETYVKISLPPVHTAAGIARAQARLISEASKEKLSLEQADRLSAMIENRRRALETVEIEQNLQQANESLAAREEAEKQRR